MTNASLELASGRPVYRYYIAWAISGDLALEIELTGVTWSRQIRRAGQLSGTLFLPEDKRLQEAYWATMPGRMHLFVTRNNKPVWGGYISARTYDASNRTLELNATGFEGYLYRRFIWHDTVQANTVDQYQVVRNLIGMMQTDFQGLATQAADFATPHPASANLGILVDARNSGKHQDTQTWLGYEYTSFGEALEAFSDNLNGFEYNIEVDWDLQSDKFIKRLIFRDTPPSQLPLGVEYTGTRPGLDENFFEFPGNVIALSYDDTIDDAADRFWVTGATPDPISTGDDTESIQLPTYRNSWTNEAYLSTQWPIFEAVESSEHNDVSDITTLANYAASYGRRVKPPIPAWNVTVSGSMNPQVGTYNPGDWCRLVVTDPFLSQSIESTGTITKVLTKRIGQFSVSVPDTEQTPETVALTLIDEWSDEGTS